MADPGEAGGPKLQTSGHQVVEVVQGMVNCPSLRDVSADTVDIPEGPAGGTLGDRPWRLADAVLGISSAVGFPAPLIEVAVHIHGRNVKALIDYGSMSNYISDSLVLALKMEVILEQGCVPTAMGVNSNGHFNGMGTAVAPVPIAASAGSRCSCC